MLPKLRHQNDVTKVSIFKPPQQNPGCTPACTCIGRRAVASEHRTWFLAITSPIRYRRHTNFVRCPIKIQERKAKL